MMENLFDFTILRKFLRLLKQKECNPESQIGPKIPK